VTGVPHIYYHDVSEEEVEEVLSTPGEDRPGRDDSRVALGETHSGRFLRVIYVTDPEPESVFVITVYDLLGKTTHRLSSSHTTEKAMKKPNFPKDWDEKRVQDLLAHYESKSEEEAVAEDEATLEDPSQTVMEMPSRLVPAVRELIAENTWWCETQPLRPVPVPGTPDRCYVAFRAVC